MTETTTVSTDLTPAAPDPTTPAVEPAIVAEMRAALGTRRHPATGARVDRLDLIGETLAPETATLAVLWLASERRASSTTRRGYADDLAQWADWYARERGGRLDLATLSRADVALWVSASRAAGHRPATIARRLSALSSLYRYAASHGLPLVCPITEDHRPRVERGRHDRSAAVLDLEEVRALVASASDARDALVVALLATTGLRVSELTTADDSDVVVEQGRTWLWVTRKGGRRQRVPVDPAAADLLARYQAERPACPDGDAPLIRDAAGHRIDRHDVTRLLRRVARAAGLPRPERVTPHALRASGITALVEAGRPVTEVQQWAGHSQVTTTMVYVESRGRDARAAAMTADLAAAVVDVPCWVSGECTGGLECSGCRHRLRRLRHQVTGAMG